MRKIIEIFSQYKGLSRSAYVIFIGRMVTNMGAFIWPLLTLIMKDKIGYSPTTIAYIFLGVGVLFLPANIIGGKLADKFSRKKLIVIFDSISIFFFMLCAFVEPGNLMMVFFVIAGLFANMEGPAFEALVADVTKPNEREKVYSLMYLGHNLGFMFGAAIGGLLFANYLSLAFVLDGLTTLSSTILIVIFVKVIDVSSLDESEKNEYEDTIEHDAKVSGIFKERPSILIQLIVFFFAAFVYDQWSFVLPMYMTDMFGVDLGSKYFGFVASFNAFVVISCTPILTYLFRRLHELPKVFMGQLLIGISYVIIMNRPAYYIFFVMMFAFTIGEIVNMLGSSPYMSRRVPSSHRGRVNSFRNIAYFVGSASGRVIMGWIVEKGGYSTAFATVATIGILTTFIVAVNYFIDRKVFPKLYEGDSVLSKDTVEAVED
ncbi:MULTISPECIES: MFS transporter [unclassified Fusibacter]|uniref:MFS transporter n=1 Tax=unclassified Fusibacter TaxID=2624464 RepID=UPI00101118BE|nr:MULTISPECIES: MFS transporter [unclassified Fusibacter]MCK8060341.1 MFS transporter [Fusibacter sp. A2]NPE20370.1 MFS transporter [Fusibacter sp. A1]RXV63576.1 MFS transporter [Fusibacter sp. A1]